MLHAFPNPKYFQAYGQLDMDVCSLIQWQCQYTTGIVSHLAKYVWPIKHSSVNRPDVPTTRYQEVDANKELALFGEDAPF